MIKRTILLIIEFALYGFIMNKFSILNEYTFTVGLVVALFTMAISVIDDIAGDLREIRRCMQALTIEIHNE